MTPDGSLLVIPNHDPLSSTNYFTRICNNEENLSASGVLASFKENGIVYYGWYNKSTREFKGYAPEIIVNGKKTGDWDNAYQPDNALLPDVGNVLRLYHEIPAPKGNAVVNTDPEYVLKRGLFSYTTNTEIRRYLGPSSHGFIQESEFTHENLIVMNSGPGTACYLSELPTIPFVSTFKDLGSSPQSGTNNNVPADYTSGCNFLDLTADSNGDGGRFKHYKDVLGRDYEKNRTDIVISDESVKASDISEMLSQVNSSNRVVVWVHVEGNVAKRKVIVPNAIKNKLDEKTVNLIMHEADVKSDANPSGAALSDDSAPGNGVGYSKKGEGNQLLTCLGYSRLLISTAMEFLDGVSLNDPKYWDSNNPEYFLKDAPYVNILKVTGFDRLIAMGCGAWTGVVDVLKDQLGNLESIQQILEFLFDEEKRNEMLGSVKELYESLKDEEMRAFMLASLVNQASEAVEEVANNPNRRWYYAGYFPTNIIFGVISGSIGQKLKGLLTNTVGKTYKNMMGKATAVFDNVGSTMHAGEYKKFLQRFSKIPNTDLRKIDGTENWEMKHNGQVIGVVNKDGRVTNAAGGNINNNDDLEYLGTFECEDANGNVSERRAYKKKGSSSNGEEAVIFVAKESDDLVKRILKKYDMDLSDVNINKLTIFVNQLGGEKAAEFLNDEMADAFKVFENQAGKMEFFEEIGQTFIDGKGVGKIFQVDGKLSKSLIESWHIIKLNKEWRGNSKYLKKIARYVDYNLKIEKSGNKYIVKQSDGTHLGSLDPNDVYDEGELKVLGFSSGRHFDPDKAGGTIIKKNWVNISVTQEGIEDIKRHLLRFKDTEAIENNKYMLLRLQRIKNGDLDATEYDKRFYTHELEEYDRFKKKGVGHGDNNDVVYQNTHTASLEVYSINEKDQKLYHPSVPFPTWAGY